MCGRVHDALIAWRRRGRVGGERPVRAAW